MCQGEVAVAPARLFQTQLQASYALARCISRHLARQGIPPVRVEDVTYDRGGEVGVTVMARGAWITFRVLAQPFDKADDAVELSLDAIARDLWLIAQLQLAQFVGRPLVAGVVASRDALLLDFPLFRVEIVLVQPA